VTGIEDCDDGINNATVRCLANCAGAKSGYLCIGGNATSPSSCSPVCGDGMVMPEEICDDGGPTYCNGACTGPLPGYFCHSGG
jgi:hypothetical protein